MIAASPSPSTPTRPTLRVGDERLIRITANAAKKVTSLLTKQGRPQGVLRVAVIGGGCSGLQYKMDLQDGPANRDFLVESGGIRVVVDPKSALYVSGSELDFVATYQPAKWSEFQFGYGHFFVGDYIKQSVASAPANRGAVDADWVYVQAKLNF